MAEPINNYALERVAEDLEHPLLDNRTYRVIKLKNNLEALLIHDPDTDKVSAALDVDVGSFSDASDMPGLAHAVEHLLFMGTKKYPKENAYNEYLAAHSGSSNAFTAATSTNYYFEVAAGADKSSEASKETPEEPALYGALDRFAQFFVAPLFLADTVDRELRAVDSENKKNLQNDTWRLHQLNKSLSNPEHPFNHFSTGNYKTLHDDPLARGVKIRDEFIKFYEKHYSANRMKLVVLGREPLETLEKWVVELFSAVPNKDLEKNRWDGIPVFTEKEVGMEIFTKPVYATRRLDLYFPYQDEEDLYSSQPGRYLSHLIGHEGPGSILAYIKAKGWAHGLGTGPVALCPGSALYSITVKLTPEGQKHYKEVTKVIFQYIAMLRQQTPHQWIHDELKRVSEVDFKYKQKSPASRTTSNLSGVMQKPLPRKWLLSGLDLIRDFNPERIKSGLDLLRPDNFRLTIVSQDTPSRGEWDQNEKWYGTQYKYVPMEKEFLDELKTTTTEPAENRPKEIHLPLPNEFIPTRLEVEKKEIAKPLKAPKLIRNDDNIRIWFKKDDRFWVPKANVMFTFRTPIISITPRNTMLGQLWKELVIDELVEYSYNANIAGLDYDLHTHALGVDLSISGYNDKMPVLLERVLTSIRDLKVKDDRFEIVKERLTRGFNNFDYQQPYHQVGTYSLYLSNERGWINDQYIDELKDTTADDVRYFTRQLLSQLHIEVLAHGNLHKEDVFKLSDMAERVLNAHKLPSSQWPIRRSLIFPSSSAFAYDRTLKDPANVNHCIEYLLQVGAATDRELRAKLLLLAQITEEPVFDQLRTKEQLGYVVFSGAKTHNMWSGYRVLIQSEKTPEYLESRIEEFLRNFEKTLEDMSDEKFQKYKRSLINKRKEKLKNLSQESTRFWLHISSEKFDFEQNDRDVEHIEPITKDAFLDFFRTYISVHSPRRSVLTVNLLAQATAPTLSPTEQSTKLVEFFKKYLAAMEIPLDVEKFTARLTGAGNLSQEAVSRVAEDYLRIDAQAAEDKITTLVEGGKQALGPVLAALGISKTESESSTEQESASAKKDKIKITNAHAWKATMAVSSGMRPVQDLSEFEDIEPKL